MSDKKAKHSPYLFLLINRKHFRKIIAHTKLYEYIISTFFQEKKNTNEYKFKCELVFCIIDMILFGMNANKDRILKDVLQMVKFSSFYEIVDTHTYEMRLTFACNLYASKRRFRCHRITQENII